MDVKKEDIFSVSEVSRLVKNVIDINLPPLWIEGEIANYVHHSSGHIYFSLKDDRSTIRCAFFRNYNKSLSFKPRNGDKVLSNGKIDVYEKTGTYQLLVKNILPAGIGELQLKYLALKKKLDAEGLFSPLHKKNLPPYPEKIGVVTSATGAAFQDIRNVITRRYPHNLYLYPAAVQGEKAANELIAGLQYFNRHDRVDLIIIGRGGGSQEDLFCFNDENLAREIFSSKIPVISAVGHEIDFTIADFVADVRAPTPSAAAELAVPDKTELLAKINSYHKNMYSLTKSRMLSYRNTIGRLENKIHQWHPRNVLHKYQQRLDEAVNSFYGKMQEMAIMRQQLDSLSRKLSYGAHRVSSGAVYRKRLLLDGYKNRLINAANKNYNAAREELSLHNEHLMSLSPQLAMKRGYGIIRKEKRLVKSVSELQKNDCLEVILVDGNCQCTVDKVYKSDCSRNKKKPS